MGVTIAKKQAMLSAVYYAQLLIPDFALIACGYLICRFTKLDSTVWAQVNALVYFFLFPVLLFQSITRYPLDVASASQFILAGLCLALLGMALAYSVAHWPVAKRYFDARDHAASAQVAFRFNSFIALAITQKVVGDQGLMLVAVLIGICVPLYNIGAVWPMARHGKKGLGRELVENPLIWATVVALLANFSGFRMPDWLAPTFSRLGQTGLVLGLMAAGAGMQLSALPRAKVLAVAMLGIKHLGLPVAAWLLARLWGLDATQAAVLLIFSAMPTASSCYVLAARMGFNGPYVASLVTLSTVLAMFSLPFALGVLGGLAVPTT
jgi:malonate transporter and related proteins